MATKKVGAAGRFRAGYGKTVRGRITKIEERQRQKQKCPYCKEFKVKRIAKGIWQCTSCDRKFASKAYFVE